VSEAGTKDCRPIFISYTRKDGAAFAAKLYSDLEEAGFTPWMDRTQLDPGVSWATEIESAIDRCAKMITILSVGYIDSNICRAEHMRALRKRKPVIPLLIDRDADRPLHLETLNRIDFSPAANYSSAFANLINLFSRASHSEPLPLHFEETFVNAPVAPPGYVPRPEELEMLRRAVIGDESNREIALTALEGMGGVGKSVLAAALCRDSLIQAAFPDGVLWVTIGRSPGNLVPQMRQIGSVFGDKPELYETTESGAARLRQLLRGKTALLVLDDVWNYQHVLPFLTSGNRCRILLTSRDRKVASRARATEVRLGSFTADQSMRVLEEWVGRPGDASSKDALRRIAECAAHHPLALTLAGARLREGMSAESWLKQYGARQLHLASNYHDRSPSNDLEACFDISLDGYQPMQQQLFFALSIFPEDLRIPLFIVARLWRQIDPSLTDTACRELLHDFSRLELINLDLTNLDETGAVTLHDLMQEYGAVKLAAEQPRAHQDFLRSYVDSHERWWQIENDGYIFHHLAHHLAGAGKQAQLQHLLLDFRWLQAKLDATDPAALLADFSFIPTTPDNSLVFSAIQLSVHVLAHHPAQLATQLTGRLIGSHSRAIQKLLDGARRFTRHPWLRPLEQSLTPAGGSLVKILEGHEAGVSSVLFTPGDNTLISASFDGTIRLWDWRRGLEIDTLVGHRRQINALAISADGATLVSGSSDRTVRVWDLEQRKIKRLLKGLPFAAVRVSIDDNDDIFAETMHGDKFRWTPDNDLLIDETGASAIENQQRLTAQKPLAAISDAIRAEVSEDGKLQLVDSEKGSLLRVLGSHPSPIFALAATQDGKVLISGHNDGALRLWDTGSLHDSYRALPKPRPMLIALVPGLGHIAATHADGALRIWTPASAKAERRLLPHRQIVSLRPSLSGMFLVAINWNLKQITVDRFLGLPIPDLRSIRTLFPSRLAAAVAAGSPFSFRIVFSNEDSFWSAWSLWTNSVKVSRGNHRTKITALAMSLDGRRIVSGSEDGEIKLWKSWSRKELFTLQAHSGAVSTLAISPGARYIVSAGASDKTLKLWDCAKRTEIARFSADSSLQSCALGRFSRTIIATDISGQLHAFVLERHTLPRHSSPSDTKR
jgi:WD40 repeat protein